MTDMTFNSRVHQHATFMYRCTRRGTYGRWHACLDPMAVQSAPLARREAVPCAYVAPCAPPHCAPCHHDALKMCVARIVPCEQNMELKPAQSARAVGGRLVAHLPDGGSH